MIALLERLQQPHGIAPQNTVIAGFSQYGIMSACVAPSSADSLKGFGLLSGRILPELEPFIAGKERLAKRTVSFSQGEQDTTLPVHWVQRSDALPTRLGVPHRLRL